MRTNPDVYTRLPVQVAVKTAPELAQRLECLFLYPLRAPYAPTSAAAIVASVSPALTLCATNPPATAPARPAPMEWPRFFGGSASPDLDERRLRLW